MSWIHIILNGVELYKKKYFIFYENDNKSSLIKYNRNQVQSELYAVLYLYPINLHTDI
jgi:hypothetical protein